MKRRILLLATILVMLVGIPLLFLDTERIRGPSQVHQSIHDSSNFVVACWSYREHTPGRKFPAELSDLLLRSPQGIGPFKDMRDDKCDDPWGNPYKYALVPNENGDLEPYVWAESIVDGKLRLYGAKCGADGMVIRFGWPEGR